MPPTAAASAPKARAAKPGARPSAPAEQTNPQLGIGRVPARHAAPAAPAAEPIEEIRRAVCVRVESFLC